MDLLQTFAEYASKDQAVEKAAFEAAMVEKLKDNPYKMSDLLYALYRCQRDFESLKDYAMTIGELLFELQARMDAVSAPKPKAHKKKK